jgi:hypothetical protein
MACISFIKETDDTRSSAYALNHPSYFENKVRRTVLSWIPPKVTMLHLQTKVYYEK